MGGIGGGVDVVVGYMYLSSSSVNVREVGGNPLAWRFHVTVFRTGFSRFCSQIAGLKSERGIRKIARKLSILISV